MEVCFLIEDVYKMMVTIQNFVLVLQLRCLDIRILIMD
jgi:hypothetical protein